MKIIGIRSHVLQCDMPEKLGYSQQCYATISTRSTESAPIFPVAGEDHVPAPVPRALDLAPDRLARDGRRLPVQLVPLGEPSEDDGQAPA